VSARAVVITLVCVALLAAGQVLFKIAAGHWRVDGLTARTLTSFLSGWMVVALVVYAIATVLWVYVLRTVPLSVAYPLFALAFILTPVVAHYVLDEPLSWRVFAGGAVIVAGVVIATGR
jgi:drug/metabolite transporter (DMT)-like permease